MSCIKYVTIDFDALERTPTIKAFFLVRILFLCKTVKIKCVIRKSKKGLHVYINIPLEFWKRYVIRSILFDDPARIEIDEKRHFSGAHEIEETLFEAKCQKEYCYNEQEIDINELDRILFKEFSPVYAH